MAKLRTCKICGKQYEYCGHCPNKNVIEPWRNLYCSENCRDSYTVMSDYVSKKKDAMEAKIILQRFGITPNKVRDVHKEVITKIYNEAARTFIEPPKEVKESSAIEEKKEEPFYVRRNKNKKKANDIVNRD
jgi:hypothetical protein